MLTPVMTKLMLAFAGIPKKLKAFMDTDPKWKAAVANKSQPRSGLVMGGHRGSGPATVAADASQADVLADALYGALEAYEQASAEPTKCARAVFFIRGDAAQAVLAGSAPVPPSGPALAPAADAGLGVAVVVEADLPAMTDEPAPASWPPAREAMAGRPAQAAVRIVSIGAAAQPADAGPIMNAVEVPKPAPR